MRAVREVGRRRDRMSGMGEITRSGILAALGGRLDSGLGAAPDRLQN